MRDEGRVKGNEKETAVAAEQKESERTENSTV